MHKKKEFFFFIIIFLIYLVSINSLEINMLLNVMLSVINIRFFFLLFFLVFLYSYDIKIFQKNEFFFFFEKYSILELICFFSNFLTLKINLLNLFLLKFYFYLNFFLLKV